MSRSKLCGLLACLSFLAIPGFSQKLTLNDSGYFETRGVNVMVFSNPYNGVFFDEKTSGIELIHHGVRTATGGAVRLQNTPEQWDQIPKMIGRRVDRQNNSIEVELRYDQFDFNARVVVTGRDKGVEINVFLDKPLPDKLVGNAGFNLEFLPASYFEKTWLVDDRPGEFPLYPSGFTQMEPLSKKIPQFAGHTTFDDRGRNEFIVPGPMATGRTIVLAPEDPERRV
ncbi:MAG: glycoside hydrolase, partial [Bacteroidota bacterium]|nr:glycoside hydrolase [Bacteroidota bacterium]